MLVSFAVVAYNEEKYLPKLLECLCNQDYPHSNIEVLLIDSMSTDGTIDVMNQFKNENPDFHKVLILKNENKTLPYGCNVALSNYSGDVIVRLDGHAVIPNDFISKNVAVIEEGESISGGRVDSILEDDTDFQNTLLIAEKSAFCGGVASFRRLEKKAYVSTTAFAMYKREVYDSVGYYNELLARTEDNEMHYRIRQKGFKFCFDPQIVSERYTRSTLGKLTKQKFMNGYWIGKTMGICPGCFSIYHFVPLAFVLGIIFTTLLACIGYPMLALLMWIAYALANIGATIIDIKNNRFRWTNLLLPIIYVALHISYGVGTLKGLIELPFWLKKIRK